MFLGLPDLTIVQNPHAQDLHIHCINPHVLCANYKKHYVMECVGYKASVPCEVPVRNLGKLYNVSQNFSRAQKWAQCPARSTFPSTKNVVLFGTYCAPKHDLDKLGIPTRAPSFSLTVL